MNSTFLTGAGMICAGKLQQIAGRISNNRTHQILGFDLEQRGKTVIAQDAMKRSGLQAIRIRNRR